MDDKLISKEYVRHTLTNYIFETCRGCKVNPEICGMISTNNQGICPCIECLVKPMCTDQCYDYDNIFSRAIGCTPSPSNPNTRYMEMKHEQK